MALGGVALLFGCRYLAELFGNELVLLASGVLDRRQAVRGKPLFDLERTCQRTAEKIVVV